MQHHHHPFSEVHGHNPCKLSLELEISIHLYSHYIFDRLASPRTPINFENFCCPIHRSTLRQTNSAKSSVLYREVIWGKIWISLHFWQKEVLCPPVQVPHCGAEVWMADLGQASRPPFAQNRLSCPQPATGGVRDGSWDINSWPQKTTENHQHQKAPKPQTNCCARNYSTSSRKGEMSKRFVGIFLLTHYERSTDWSVLTLDIVCWIKIFLGPWQQSYWESCFTSSRQTRTSRDVNMLHHMIIVVLLMCELVSVELIFWSLSYITFSHH